MIEESVDFEDCSPSCLMPGQHTATFGGHRLCGRRDIIFLVCLVISQDRVIKGSCDYMGGSLSRKVTVLPSFVAIGTAVKEM